jgi:3-oxoacyl-(acyl-carrier-protein) synthase
MAADVAIVGCGCILPQGEGATALDRVLAGQSAAAVWSQDPRYVVGQVPAGLVRPVEGESRAVSLALRAADLALSDVGLSGVVGVPADRFGCLFTVSKGALDRLVEIIGDLRRNRPVSSDWLMAIDPAVAARRIAAHYGWRGPVLALLSACSSGGHVLAEARALILDGRADVVLCGAADASLAPLVLASYQKLGLLAPVGPNPAEICRPFAADRAGFYVGEGAAAFVVCSTDLARRLGLNVRAILEASAAGAAATGLVDSPADGAALGQVIRLAMARGGVSPGEVDLVVAHGTATRDGDLNETRALRAALGAAAAGVQVVATKPLHGHLLGAACAIETALLLRAMETGCLAPVANLKRRDPECDLNYVTAGLRAARIHRAIKLSAGFGGHISVNIFCRPSRREMA